MRPTGRRSISGPAGCSSSDRTRPNGPRGEAGRVIEHIQRFVDDRDPGVVPHAATREHLDLCAIGRSALILYHGPGSATDPRLVDYHDTVLELSPGGERRLVPAVQAAGA